MTTRSSSQSESTLTDRYQTTIPSEVRKALGLSKRDKIRYTISSNGQVILSRAEHTEEDPALSQFLSFLAHDISVNSHHVRAVNSELVNRTQSLVADVDFDIEAPLPDEDN